MANLAGGVSGYGYSIHQEYHVYQSLSSIKFLRQEKVRFLCYQVSLSTPRPPLLLVRDNIDVQGSLGASYSLSAEEHQDRLQEGL